MERRTILALFPVIQQDGSKNLTKEKDLVIMKQVQSESIRYRQKEDRDVTNRRYIPVFIFFRKELLNVIQQPCQITEEAEREHRSLPTRNSVAGEREHPHKQDADKQH